MLDNLIIAGGLIAAALSGAAFTYYWMILKIANAADTESSVWLLDRFYYIAHPQYWHHLQVCQMRCQVRDTRRELVAYPASVGSKF